MNELTMYLMVIVAVGVGIILMSKRFLKKHQTKEFGYRSKRNMANDLPIKKRINFRNKPFSQKENQLPNRHLGFRDSYNKALRKSSHISNVDLNRNFWIALGVLVSIVLIIIIL